MICINPWTSIHYFASQSFGPCCGSDRNQACSAGLMEDFDGTWYSYMRWKIAQGGRCSHSKHLVAGDKCLSAMTVKFLREGTFAPMNYGQGPGPELLKSLKELRVRIRTGATKANCPPLKVILCPDLTCNLNCVHCSQRQMDLSAIAPIPKKTLDDILQHHERIGFIQISGGEPFASEHTMWFMRELAERRCAPAIFLVTNGVLTDFDIIAGLNIQQVSISIDGATSETYAKHRGKPLFDHVTNTLRKVAAMPGHCRTLRPRVRYTLTRWNVGELSAAVNLFEKDIGAELSIQKLIGPPGGGGVPEQLFEHADDNERRDALKSIKAAMELTADPFTRQGLRSELRRIRGLCDVPISE